VSEIARPLRAGVIGLGSMGVNHARVYAEIEGVELAAVADVSGDRLDLAPGQNRYDDYRRMLSAEHLDLVSICVPTLLHREVALAAIDSGVALLVEKPIAATLDEGRAVSQAAKRARVPLMVGHVERFNPAVTETKRLLAAGDLGRVYQLYARRTGPFPARVRDVGVVHDLAPHDIDIISFLLGSQADYLSQQLCFYPRGPDGRSPADAPQPIAVETAEPLRLELEAFVDAVRRNVPPPVTAGDGLAALEIASLLVESAQTGMAIEVPQGDRV
jgi:predicted dehydrogenase